MTSTFFVLHDVVTGDIHCHAFENEVPRPNRREDDAQNGKNVGEDLAVGRHAISAHHKKMDREAREAAHEAVDDQLKDEDLSCFELQVSATIRQTS
jgi:hypothetical protein